MIPTWFWLLIAALAAGAILLAFDWGGSSAARSMRLFLIGLIVVCISAALVFFVQWYTIEGIRNQELKNKAAVAGEVAIRLARAKEYQALALLDVETRKLIVSGGSHLGWMSDVLKAVYEDNGVWYLPSQHPLGSGTSEQMQIKQAGDVLSEYGLVKKIDGKRTAFVDADAVQEAWALALRGERV